MKQPEKQLIKKHEDGEFTAFTYTWCDDKETGSWKFEVLVRYQGRQFAQVEGGNHEQDTLRIIELAKRELSRGRTLWDDHPTALEIGMKTALSRLNLNRSVNGAEIKDQPELAL